MHIICIHIHTIVYLLCVPSCKPLGLLLSMFLLRLEPCLFLFSEELIIERLGPLSNGVRRIRRRECHINLRTSHANGI